VFVEEEEAAAVDTALPWREKVGTVDTGDAVVWADGHSAA
jgi:hypothetical protein